MIILPRIRQCRVTGCHRPAFLPNHYCVVHIKNEAEYRAKRNRFAHAHSHNPQTQWRYNHITRYRNGVKAKQNKFYHSKEWKTLRELVLNRDLHLCRYCRTLGQLNEGNVVDHILPIERFPNEMRAGNNLVTCCNNCHYWKTRWEEQYYGTGLHGKQTNNPAITDIKTIAKAFNKLRNGNALNGE